MADFETHPIGTTNLLIQQQCVIDDLEEQIHHLTKQLYVDVDPTDVGDLGAQSEVPKRNVHDALHIANEHIRDLEAKLKIHEDTDEKIQKQLDDLERHIDAAMD